MENFQLLLTDFHYSINAMKSKLIMNQDKDNYNKKYYIFENNLITFLPIYNEESLEHDERSREYETFTVAALEFFP